MLEAMGQGLTRLLEPAVLLYMMAGVLYGNFVGFVPGISGAFALATLVPFTFGLDPAYALVLLLGAHSVVNTGSSVSAILFGAPGAPGSAATAFDGYPLAKQGQGARAVAAALMASAVGGVIGAGVQAFFIPVVRPVVLAFGPPELFMLALAGITFIAQVGEGPLLKGLVAGGLGLLLAMVGQELSTATLRYTFGQLYLWEGVPLVPVVIGLFAVAEMLELTVRGGSVAGEGQQARGSIWQGVLDVFRHWSLTVRSSLLGAGIGLIPGIGGDVANFLAYGQAVQTSRRPERFGKGAIEGVIAPEAANNSKEGGALIPTLAFGLPGSASMAILLSAFLIFGLQPGPAMLTEHLDLVWLTVWTLVIANVAGAGIMFAATPLLARVTFLRASLVVPVILLFSIFGAYSTHNDFGDVLMAFGFGLLGYLMKQHGYSRAALIIGLVLGRLVEKNFLLSLQIHGWRFLLRPITLALLAAVVVSVALPALRRALRERRGRVESTAGA